MVKTLGVTWLPGEDVFTFNANPPKKDFPLTKWNFLKRIAKLFDPVGFLDFLLYLKQFAIWGRSRPIAQLVSVNGNLFSFWRRLSGATDDIQ